jgi:hypothetical protein
MLHQRFRAESRNLSSSGQALSVSVADLAALKALTTRPDVVTVKTGQAAGQWQWVSGSSTTADDALVVQCTSGAAGRYKRIYSGAVNVRWFGAAADGTDDGPEFQAAINSISSGQAGTIIVPSGTYTLTTTPTENSRFPFFVFEGGATVVGTFTLNYIQTYSDGINFDNGAFRVGSNDAFSGTGALVIGGADMRENGNGSYLVNDGHPDWNAIQTTMANNPTEFAIYSNQTGGIASASGTTITKSTGPDFTEAMEGNSFWYNGTEYTVDSVTNTTTLELTGSAGTSSDKTWHYVLTTGSGTCNVSGATVTRVTGEPFPPFISGTGFVFKINGVTRTVSTWDSVNQFTLSSAPGDVTGAAFTFRLNINDQLSTLRIGKLAASASEENVSLYSRPDGYYLAALSSNQGSQWPVFLCSGYTGSDPQKVAELHPTGKYFSLGGASGNEAIRANWLASAVNYIDAFGSIATSAPSLATRGTDTNIGFGFDTKGTGAVTFTSHSFGNTEFQIFGAGGSSWLAAASDGFDAPTLSANGAASNIDIKLAPKGTGAVWLGAWTSNADAAVNGYVTVKDSSGNARKLATIA